MLLSDKKILEKLERENIIIEPFEPRQLGTNSYDVRLGPYYYVPNHNMVTVNFADIDEAHEFWRGPFYAENGIISVRPGETILAHTLEIIGAHNGFTASMGARSSIGRSCLTVCKCAGVGDVGYISRWTMEISNLSHAIIRLAVGQRVAQILFNEVGVTAKEYSGKYGARKNWTPEDMLPKLYMDWDLQSDGRIGIPFEEIDYGGNHSNGNSPIRLPVS